jgi:hypothetical protein
MSHAARPSEGINPVSFTNAIAMAVEQMLTACGSPPTRNDNIQFSISPALAQPDILDYSPGIFSKATEPLKTTFSVKNPNIRILFNEIQVRSESFGWNLLFQINRSQKSHSPNIQYLRSTHSQNIQNLRSTHRKCRLQDVQRETVSYLNTNSRKRQNNYQLYMCLTNSIDDNTKRILADEEQACASSGQPCRVANHSKG